MLHDKQISVQLSTGTGYTGPKSPIERSSLSSKDMEKEKSRNSTEQQESRKCKENKQKEQRSFTTVTNQELGVMEKVISLRTMSVVVCNGKVRMTVNTLLDDASTKTYLSTDFIEQRKLKGIPETVTLIVLSSQIKTFETLPVEINLEILSERIKQKLSAYTADRVKWKGKWKHLKNTNFPTLDRRPMVDILIGMDYQGYIFQ